MRRITTPQYAAVLSTVAIAISLYGLWLSKKSYDLSVAKDQREARDKRPAIDVQMRPNKSAAADITIAITNRSEINIAPQAISVANTVELGTLYLSDSRQSIDQLKTTLSLLSMGTIAPKATATMKAALSSVTDGTPAFFAPGTEIPFSVQIRLADEQDTIETFEFIRRVR